jgi:hypothetical protein
MTYIPDIKESDVVWQFSPQVACDAWRANEYFGADSLRRDGDGWWSAHIGGDSAATGSAGTIPGTTASAATVRVKFATGWVIESSECSVDSEEKGPRCLHVAELLFELTRQSLVNMEESPARVRAKQRATAVRKELPFPAVALPEVDDLAQQTLSLGGIGSLLEERDWLDIVRIMELMTSMSDLRMAVRRRIRQEFPGSVREAEEQASKDLSFLPFGWFSILEAGYEILGDLDGLKALYEFYIVTNMAHSPRGTDDIDYHRRLEILTGNDFESESRYVANVAYTEMTMEFGRTRALEDLIQMTKLSDDALFYCNLLQDSDKSKATSEMAVTIALKHSQEAGEFLLEPLFDADSWLYKKRDFSLEEFMASSEMRVQRQLRRVKKVLGAQKAAEMASRIMATFPKRRALVSAVKLFVGGASGEDKDQGTGELRD